MRLIWSVIVMLALSDTVFAHDFTWVIYGEGLALVSWLGSVFVNALLRGYVECLIVPPFAWGAVAWSCSFLH